MMVVETYLADMPRGFWIDLQHSVVEFDVFWVKHSSDYGRVHAKLTNKGPYVHGQESEDWLDSEMHERLNNTSNLG